MIAKNLLYLKKDFINYLERELRKVKIKKVNSRDILEGYYDSKYNTIAIDKKIKDKEYIKEVVLHEMGEWMMWKIFKNTKYYGEEKKDKNKTYYVIDHADIDKIARKILRKIK